MELFNLIEYLGVFNSNLLDDFSLGVIEVAVNIWAKPHISLYLLCREVDDGFMQNGLFSQPDISIQKGIYLLSAVYST